MKKPAFLHNILVTNDNAPVIDASGPVVVNGVKDFYNSMGKSVISRLMANDMRIKGLRTNDLLRKEEWIAVDAAVLQIAVARLTLLDTMRQYGLTTPVPGGLGVLITQYERSDDMAEAEVSMSGIARTQEDSHNFDLVSTPIPVISKDFRINIRRLLASRRTGEGIDVMQVQTATRKVTEMIIKLILNGYPGKLDGNQLYGFTTHPDRNTATASGSWSAQDKAYNDVVTGITTLQGDHYYGPYGLLVNNTSYLNLLGYVTNRDTTFLQRIQAIPGLSFVQPIDQLPAGVAVLFQLTKDVIDVQIAEDITTVEWDEHGGLTAQYKIMTALAPRPKSDQGTQSGILVITGTT